MHQKLDILHKQKDFKVFVDTLNKIVIHIMKENHLYDDFINELKNTKTDNGYISCIIQYNERNYQIDNMSYILEGQNLLSLIHMWLVYRNLSFTFFGSKLGFTKWYTNMKKSINKIRPLIEANLI